MSEASDQAAGAPRGPARPPLDEELELAVPGLHPLARRRMTAYAVDLVGCAGIAASTVPLGLLVRRTGRGATPRATLWLSAVPVLAATCVAAVAESRDATHGKRRCGLRVVRTDGRPLGPGRALLRNTVKIAIPWHLGHVVAIAAALGDGARPRGTVTVAAVATYGLQLAALAGVLSPRGRTLHDLVSGSRVVAAEAGRGGVT